MPTITKNIVKFTTGVVLSGLICLILTTTVASAQGVTNPAGSGAEEKSPIDSGTCHEMLEHLEVFCEKIINDLDSGILVDSSGSQKQGDLGPALTTNDLLARLGKEVESSSFEDEERTITSHTCCDILAWASNNLEGKQCMCQAQQDSHFSEKLRQILESDKLKQKCIFVETIGNDCPST